MIQWNLGKMVKFKNRYVLVRIVADPILSSKSNTEFVSSDVFHAISDSIGSIHGDYGVGACKQHLNVKVFNEETKILVIRISRSSSSLLLTSMPFVSKIGKTPAMLQTLHVGGSIRSCEKVLVRYHKMELISSLKKTENLSEKKRILEIFRDVSKSLRTDRLKIEKIF